jgi:hypothetical protein
MDETTTCGNCRGEVTTDSDYCPHCGVFFEQAPVVPCDQHGDREADGVCIICGKCVCEQCSVRRGDRLFCSDHEDVSVEGDWAHVLASADEFSVNCVVDRLKAEGIEVERMGQGTIFRTPTTILLTPIPSYMRASEIVDEVIHSEKGPYEDS